MASDNYSCYKAIKLTNFAISKDFVPSITNHRGSVTASKLIKLIERSIQQHVAIKEGR